MTTIGKFQIETDNLDLIREVLRPLVITCLNCDKPSDNVHLWLRHDTPPTRGWSDGSDYSFKDSASVVDLGGKYCITKGGYVYGGVPFHNVVQYPPLRMTKDEAAKRAYKEPTKTSPTRLWVCSIGLWAEDGGPKAVRMEQHSVLLDAVYFRLVEARKAHKEEVLALHDDPYFDGSIGLGYRLDVYEYAFTQINASLVPIEYPK
jgi:hypothetical protein